VIQREKIEELLNLPAEERRRVLRLLQESLTEEEEAVAESTKRDPTSPAAKWLLSMAGRYSGGPGNTASRADEILRAEIDKQRGLTTN
jgi:CRP-like cAMP-binding protein